jgi:hypothetical protein
LDCSSDSEADSLSAERSEASISSGRTRRRRSSYRRYGWRREHRKKYYLNSITSDSHVHEVDSDSEIELAVTSDNEFEGLGEDLGIVIDFAKEEENDELSDSAMLGKLTNAIDTVGGVEGDVASAVGSGK